GIACRAALGKPSLCSDSRSFPAVNWEGQAPAGRPRRASPPPDTLDYDSNGPNGARLPIFSFSGGGRPANAARVAPTLDARQNEARGFRYLRPPGRALRAWEGTRESKRRFTELAP